MTPFTVKSKTSGDSIAVPCGKCPTCLARRVSGWSFRLMQQDKISETSNFITLTYDTQNVPITNKGFMSLNKRDVQLFFKRLRKSHDSGRLPIKYYAVGEYGGKTLRPHYHIILFNAQIELIQPAWQNGECHYGTVTGASVGYTLKYMSKPSRIPLHANDDRLKEFSLMSKGLGANYLTDAMRNWHLADCDNRMYVNVDGNKKVSMPRYFKDKIYSDEQRKRVAYFSRLEMIKREQKAMQEEGDNYYRNRSEKHIAEFKKMHSRSNQLRNKI